MNNKLLKRLKRYSSFYDVSYNYLKNILIFLYVDHRKNIHLIYKSLASKRLHYDRNKYGTFWISNKKYITKENKLKIVYIKELYILTILFSKPIRL